MRAKKTFAALSAACVSLVVATSAVAQDDLDDLLELDKPAKKEEAKPAEEVKPAEEKKEEVAETKSAEEEKPAEEAKPAEEKKEEVAETKPAEEEKPAEEAKPVEEKKAEVAVASQDAQDDDKELAELERKMKVPETPGPLPDVADQSAPVVVEEKPAVEAAPAPVVAEEKPAVEPAPVAKPVVAAAPVQAAPAKPEPTVEIDMKNPAAALISEIVATEKLRRDALDRQAESEIGRARAAMKTKDWETAFRQYESALTHLSDRRDPETETWRKECLNGMAEAKYQAGKDALKLNDREAAATYAKEAIKLRHPHAEKLLEAIEAKTEVAPQVDVSAIKHRRNEEDYKKDRDTIRQRLRLSSQYLAVADLDNALEQCDLVLRGDPYNQEALMLRSRIQRKRDLILAKEREATRRGMIADVSAAWRPVYAVNSAEMKNAESGTTKSPLGDDPVRSMEQSIEKRMKEMMLPSVSFRPPATIIDAVDYFRQASKDYDRPEIPVDQRGFNFVLQLDKQLTGSGESQNAGKKDDNAFGAASEDDAEGAAGDVPQVPNINAANLSLDEALKLVCKVTGFKYKVQGSVVMVMPKGMTTDELVTRSYSVVDSFVDRMNEASSSLKNEKSGDFGGGGGDDNGTEDSEAQWKAYFEAMGVNWPQNSHITYIKAIGKLRVTNTEDQLSKLEEALTELNVTPTNIEIETRFVEVAQEDLNSLGFEWLLNSDYSFNVGGKLKKALNLKDGYSRAVTETTQGQTVLMPVSSTATDGSVQNGWQPVTLGGPSSVTSGQWTRWNDALYPNQSATVITQPDGTQSTILGPITKTGKNMNVNAIDGATYQTGMRYLSNGDHIVKADGTQYNDKFMKVNAFLGNADLSMILHMLSQRSDTDLLSAPKIVTRNNQEATIKVVTIYRYPQDYDVTIQSTSSSSSSSITSGSGSGSDGKILPMVEPQNFETQEVGVILTVTPDVTPEGLINLALTPKVISEPTWKDYGMKVPMASVMSSTAQLAAQASGAEDMNWFTVPMEQPFFKERSIDTHVSLYNGSTIVMGGLITEERKSQEDKIPFLGDIPYLGRFFRSRSEWSNKRNLLLFVTARLVDPNGRQVIQNQSGDQSSDKDAKVTPAPAEK